MHSGKLSALAAVTLMIGSEPLAAQAAQSLSLRVPAVAREGASPESANELRSRGPGKYIVGAIVLGLIIWGAIELWPRERAFPVSP